LAALAHTRGKTWGSEGAAELLGIEPCTLAHRMKVTAVDKGKL